jgi:hypothetical protein
MSFSNHRDKQFDNVIIRQNLTYASSTSSGSVASPLVLVDTVNNSTTNLSSIVIRNVGTSTSASAISISSASGGISLSPASGKVVTILTGRALAVDTINQSGAATDLTISNTGSSATSTSVNISSTSGGITFTAAANKNIAVITSGTGSFTVNGSPIVAPQVLKSSVTLQRSDITSLVASPFQLVAPVPGSRISVLLVVSNYYYDTTPVTNATGATRIVYAATSTAAKTASDTDFSTLGSANILGWDQTFNTVNNIRPTAAVNNVLPATDINDAGIYLAKATSEFVCASGASHVRMDTYYTVTAY